MWNDKIEKDISMKTRQTNDNGLTDLSKLLSKIANLSRDIFNGQFERGWPNTMDIFCFAIQYNVFLCKCSITVKLGN